MIISQATPGGVIFRPLVEHVANCENIMHDGAAGGIVVKGSI